MSKRVSDAYDQAQAAKQQDIPPWPHASSAAKYMDPDKETPLGRTEEISDRFNDAGTPDASAPEVESDSKDGPNAPPTSAQSKTMVENDAPGMSGPKPPPGMRDAPDKQSFNDRLDAERAKSAEQNQAALDKAESIKSLQNPENQAQYDNDMGDDHD